MAEEENDRSGQEPLAPRQARPVTKARFGGIALLVGIAATIALGLAMRQDPASIPGRDADLCPTDETVAASATYLVDLSKPIDAADGTLLNDRLRDVTQSLRRNAELLVYVLGNDGDAPRQRIGRLCKPYSNAAIQALAKDGVELRDCDSIPAQVSASTRVAARLFCERREALAERIRTLGAAEPELPLANAHLIEALDDTALEFESRQRPYQLYVFSDMLHHAAWYSHFDIDWKSWQSTDLANLRTRDAPAAESSDLGHADIAIFHITRRGLTEQPRARRALREFWRDYFLQTFQHTAIDFVVQPTMDGYDAVPLLDRSEEEQMRFLLDQERAAVALERERLRQEAARLVEWEARLLASEARLLGSEARLMRPVGEGELTAADDAGEVAAEEAPLDGEADGEADGGGADGDAEQGGEQADEGSESPAPATDGPDAEEPAAEPAVE